MPQPDQNLKNHVRFDPLFHGFLFVGTLILLGATIYALIRQPDWWGVVRLLGVLWAIVLMFKTRLYAMKVQDRVIRLEERLRVEKLCGAERGNQLTVDQYIGLRFASDAELAGLVDKALAGNWTRKEIKTAVQSWRPDHWRV